MANVQYIVTQMTKYSMVPVLRNQHLSFLAMVIHAATCAKGHSDWCALQFNIDKNG